MKPIKNVKFDFTGQVAVVTGAASGIGKATARMFCKAGGCVMVVDQDRERGTALVEELGGCAEFIHADVSSHGEVNRAIASAVLIKRSCTLHVLVNCAAIEFNKVGNLVDMPYEMLTRILDVNLLGYIHMVRACVPRMSRGGRVVNVSSLQGLAAELPGTSYQVAKAGIFGITHALAVELAVRGITVNTVSPGSIKTEGMGNIRTGDVGLNPYRRLTPIGRRGWPEEVAAAILFLASDAASYITGANLIVDGGRIVNITPDKPRNATLEFWDDPDRKQPKS
jgi:NAD(P)-dependent dehydrogenase (short-subunit alcohol dehydrogenase family)